MNIITVLGLLAGTLTTIAFLPQVIKTWKTKSAKDVSFVMLVIFIVGVLLWLIYGIFRSDAVIVTANFVTLILNLIILSLKLKYE